MASGHCCSRLLDDDGYGERNVLTTLAPPFPELEELRLGQRGLSSGWKEGKVKRCCCRVGTLVPISGQNARAVLVFRGVDRAAIDSQAPREISALDFLGRRHT